MLINHFVSIFIANYFLIWVDICKTIIELDCKLESVPIQLKFVSTDESSLGSDGFRILKQFSSGKEVIYFPTYEAFRNISFSMFNNVLQEKEVLEKGLTHFSQSGRSSIFLKKS